MNTSSKNIFSAALGNLLEGYDFAIYAILAPILAVVFFPNLDPMISLMLVFSVFAFSFLVRPLGGLLFGYLGDQVGRKQALIISILVMSLVTLLLGLLPSYATIGIWAPILLTLLRLIQGIAISGEMTTAMTYLVEHAHQSQRGLLGSLVMCTGAGGAVISSALIALITAGVTEEQLFAWGWRIPFLLGGLIGLIVLLMRFQFEETVLYQTVKKRVKNKPSFFEYYKQLPYKPIVMAVLLTSIMAMSYYFVVGYFNAFLIETLHLPLNQVMMINFVCLLALTGLIPIMGIISDKLGRKPVLMSGIIGLILLIHPIFALLQQDEIYLVFMGEFIFVIIISSILATIPATLAEMFQVDNRNSGVSLGYNLSQAIFGGTAPLIALELTVMTQNLYAPAWYLLAGALVSLLTLLTIKESYQQPLK